MGLGKSKGPRVYEPYTSFDVLPTEYFNRRQCPPVQQSCGGQQGGFPSPFNQQPMVQVIPQQQFGYQGQQPSSIQQMPQSQLVYRPQQQYGYQAPQQNTQVFSKPSGGAVQYMQAKSQQQQMQQQQPSSNPQPTPTYAPSQINQQPQPQQQQQPIVRGSSGGIPMPANAYFMSSQTQQRTVYGQSNPQQQQMQQSVPKFNQQPQVQVVGQRIPS